MASIGKLVVKAYEGDNYIPLDKAKVTITQEGIVKEDRTNDSGSTSELELSAPPIDNSMKPTDKLPYSLCDVKVEVNGYKPILVRGCQIYPETTAIQQCNMEKTVARENGEEVINVQPNKLVGNYPPKIPEDPNKPDPKIPSGFVVLPEPVVPEFIVVHAGIPEDNSAPNYTVRYRDYIKNVASSEIFSTWAESTIRANIFCIISFTLNRIYTEWYRGQGKNFDITNSTAYDHAFTYGRNIYSNISRVVDDIFATYIKRPGKKQPLLTQYCDGVKVKCPGWLTQWGSKYLGDEGKTPYEILTNFYGSSLSLTRAKKVKGIPMSYPGYILQVGSTGTPVRTIQTYLNRIADNYPAIPKMAVDSIYGESTKRSVMTFQKIFEQAVTGKVDYPTWYSISNIYVAVTKIGELRGEKEISRFIERIFVPPIPFIDDNLQVPTLNYIDDIE